MRGANGLGFLLLAQLVLCSEARTQELRTDDGAWRAGVYSFSDETGGFRILGVSGTGKRDDPVVISQAIAGAGPVTLVIRIHAPIRPFSSIGDDANGFLHLRLVTRNDSGLPWVEFEFELQEKRGTPSVYGDGLSFDQRRQDSETVFADAYARFRDSFEPFDRLRFYEGVIDPERTGRFGFLITDFTPVVEFYLVQDPRVPTG